MAKVALKHAKNPATKNPATKDSATKDSATKDSATKAMARKIIDDREREIAEMKVWLKQRGRAFREPS